ncbi:hypothetical protein FF098_004685 [Parvularcula flava]|uniref:Ribbon-helix-helix protein CopG domain-containing protein n=1 Tax=Aquisalinus luteolus TaxID=1566827 RepID=A0A8J3A5B3_9PROT|nr:hypothetical protein [Aquisalinus luteolus]NHK27196.1 hypothetical protein [Aquisalinus luteolus]GGH94699.1 hypothetical protein GCM10011355_09500 [Aquisalinus luteolus]
MGKPRVNLRLSWKLHAELERRASGEGVTKTQIVEDALGRFFDPEANLVLEERLLRRMDAFDRRQGEIERDTALCLETLAQFVLYWLTRTEPIPEGERDAAHALGQRRFDHFIRQVARKLGNERGVAARLEGSDRAAG